MPEGCQIQEPGGQKLHMQLIKNFGGKSCNMLFEKLLQKFLKKNYNHLLKLFVALLLHPLWAAPRFLVSRNVLRKFHWLFREIFCQIFPQENINKFHWKVLRVNHPWVSEKNPWNSPKILVETAQEVCDKRNCSWASSESPWKRAFSNAHQIYRSFTFNGSQAILILSKNFATNFSKKQFNFAFIFICEMCQNMFFHSTRKSSSNGLILIEIY